MARLIETDTFTNKDISSAVAIGAYTSTATRLVHVRVAVDQAAGNGDYIIYATLQIAGSGSSYRIIPITTAAAASGVTALMFVSNGIPMDNTDVLTVYIDGLAGDTSTPDTRVDFYEKDYLRPTTTGRTLAVSSSGVADANLVSILGTAITETAGQIAAAFTKFFNKATPTGTVNSLPDAVAGASGGVAIVGSVMGKSPATLAAADVSGNLPVDLQTIKTQTVTASAGVTFPASIGTGTSTYAGADTAGTTTLLGRVVGTLDAGTHKPQTGDAYARLTGTVEPAIADLPTNTELATALGTADDATLAAIAALNNLSSAAAQSAAAAALAAYDPPTNAELEARTLLAASYFDPAADVVAHVTLVDTTTTNTDMVAEAPSTSDIKTTLEADGGKLDQIWEMTEDDGGVRRLTANALEQAPAGGGGVADWTATERDQLRYRLGIDGDTDAPTATPTLTVTGGTINSVTGTVTTDDAAIAEAVRTELAAELARIDMPISEVSAGSGSGTGTYTDTITDGSDPLDGVRVQLSSDTAGTHRIYEAFTNALGVFTMSPDPGTYYRWLDLAGYSFLQGIEVVVA